MWRLGDGSLGPSSFDSVLSESQAVNGMETTDGVPRIKFLCSFGGSILPRPLDGKLRYVGGETRIVSVHRDIRFVELMARMKELFEYASLMKYQQPEEDLDALVSVVNDDDVINMMEEYDKLGQSDGFTRLRIFLFSQMDDDSPLFDADEMESRRRYVDALNNLNDPSDFGRQSEKSGQSELFQSADRNSEVLAPQYNAHQLGPLGQFGVLHPPQIGPCNGPVVFQDHEMGFVGLQHLKHLRTAGGGEVSSQSHTPRYNEFELSCSPVYSASHHPFNDLRPPTEYYSSPSAGQHGIMTLDLHDKLFIESSSSGHNVAAAFSAIGHQRQGAYDQPSTLVDNLPMMQQGNPIMSNVNSIQFPMNQAPFEGNITCEHCHLPFERNQALLESRYVDARWKHAQAHLDQANGFNKCCCQCKEPYLQKEAALLNPDVKENGIVQEQQHESEHNRGEICGHERRWIPRHVNHWPEEATSHISVAQRLNDQYVPIPHRDSHVMPVNYMIRENPHHGNAVAEFGNEGLHENLGVAPHIHAILQDDLGMRYENLSAHVGKDDHFLGSLGPPYSLQRIGQTVIHGGPPYDLSDSPLQANGAASSGFLSVLPVGSSRLGDDNENATVVQGGNQYIVSPLDASSADDALSLNRNFNQAMLHLAGDKEPNACITAFPKEVAVDTGSISASSQKPLSFTQSGRSSNLLPPACVQPYKDMPGFAETTEPRQVTYSSSVQKCDTMGLSAASECNTMLKDLNVDTEEKIVKQEITSNESYQLNQISTLTDPHSTSTNSPRCDGEEDVVSKGMSRTDDAVKHEQKHAPGASNDVELSDECFSFIPELIASVKKAKLEGIQQIQGQGSNDADGLHDKEHDHPEEPPKSAGSDGPLVHELEPDEDLNDYQPTTPNIEQTRAEEEAVKRGLQVIKNSDLEEIRELGSGAYGAVYHGKWKGSDVAIKRIKPSCFAGRPSERERLIAEFWKEALLLSSLHHPNVVAFYGVVRDGPGGSLATVTEFMVNGSLKQVLQKKDRTIDRRKRLIIAMDASFGMEYLHEKKIVHFDLKCENLLVNMKDPHRPVCKIGDLGLSKVRQHTLVSGGIRGTLPWMAPELLSGKNNMVTEKIDVYSFGVVMWELLTGEEPYADMHCAAIIGGIVYNSLRPQIPSWCDPEWRSLMESCWSSDPGERLSFTEISQTLRKMFAALNGK